MNITNNLLKYCAITLSVLILCGCYTDTTGPMAAGTWLNHDRRTASAIVDDQAIAAKANLAITKNKTLWKESHISILAYNNSLLLVGQTKNRMYREELEKMLATIPGVGNIYNQVVIGEAIPLKTRASDTWITTQLKAKLIASRDIGMNRVKVITENNTVYMMGMLTKDEEQIATDIARRVQGVEKVVTIIERPADMP